jgi:hypothetical protein
VANLSRYDRILVMPTSSTPPRAAPAAPTAGRQPLLPQPGPGDADTDADQPPPVNPAAPVRGPVFTAFPQPQIVNPQQPAPGSVPLNPFGAQPQVGGQAAPSPATNVPTPSSGGVSVPGMIVPPPTPSPGQPAQPRQR